MLAYAEGVNGRALKDKALDVIGHLTVEQTFVPVQVLGELYAVLTRKAGRSRSRARDAVASWSSTFQTVDTTAAGMAIAMDLVVEHRLGFWDSVIVAAAAQAECRLFLSEDLHEGFSWGGLTVVNPMGSHQHPLLAAAFRAE